MREHKLSEIQNSSGKAEGKWVKKAKEKEKLNFNFFTSGSLLPFLLLAERSLLFYNILWNVPKIPFCCAVYDMMSTECANRDVGWKPIANINVCDTFHSTVQVPQVYVTVKGKMDTNVSLFEWVNHLYLFVIRLNASKKSVQSIWQTIQTICISVQNTLASIQSEVTFVQLVLTSIQLFFQSHPTFRFNNFFTATYTSFSKQKNEILNILTRFFWQ